ncbi:MAG: hypothetical protein ACRC6X_07050 [Culicoidibacterales bacterium]
MCEIGNALKKVGNKLKSC